MNYDPYPKLGPVSSKSPGGLKTCWIDISGELPPGLVLCGEQSIEANHTGVTISDVAIEDEDVDAGETLPGGKTIRFTVEIEEEGMEGLVQLDIAWQAGETAEGEVTRRDVARVVLPVRYAI